jgi:hypothetical protein
VPGGCEALMRGAGVAVAAASAVPARLCRDDGDRDDGERENEPVQHDANLTVQTTTSRARFPRSGALLHP